MITKLHVYHLISFHPSELNHHRRTNHIQNHFLSGTRFHPGTACHIFRPYNHFDGDICLCRHWRIGIAGDTTCQDTVFTGFPQSTNYVRGSAGSSNADNGVFFVDLVFDEFFPTSIFIIFGSFYRIAQGCIASCNQSDNPVGRHSESRRNFGSIQYSQATACAGPHIKDASALFHAGHNLIDKLFNLWNSLLYG